LVALLTEGGLAGVVGASFSSLKLGAGLPGTLGVVSLWPGFAGAAGWLGGTGGVPLAPGTGNAFAFGGSCRGGVALDGVTLAGVGPGMPGLTLGLIDALGGGASLPCWISDARCTTAFGKVGPTTPVRGAPAAASAAGDGVGLLMTVLMMVVLWMLLKTMLFRGAST
jgi:hypothetical protein